LKVFMKKNVKFVLAAGTALLLGACNGWPGTLPYEEALNKPENYPGYAPTAGQPVEFYAGNRRFLVLPAEANVRSARTRPVSAGAAGVSVFSLEGDEPPYASLFASGSDGRVYAVAPID
jgi:hypothetical protein